jgi:hypothetical protein
MKEWQETRDVRKKRSQSKWSEAKMSELVAKTDAKNVKGGREEMEWIEKKQLIERGC